MISAPYKGAVKEHITQTYHGGHPALDMAGRPSNVMYGVPLCAPEDCEILLIRGDTYTPETDENLKRGFGIWLKGLETGFVHLFWHNQPIHPVFVGQTVKRGQIVAFMGNTGNVYSDNTYVPIEGRTRPPYRGTHLHWELYDKTYRIGGRKPFLNPLEHIDWRSQPTYTNAEHMKALAVVIGKAAGLLNKR